MVRFGARRRQCTQCRRTWRIRPKRRGRPAYRGRPAWVARVLRQEHVLQHATGRHRGITPQAVTHRFRQALRAFGAAPRSLRLGDGDLVLLIDGVWLQFRGCPWVLYLMALKPVHADAAVFLDPVLLPGREDLTHWIEVLAHMPVALHARIRALVADDLRGFVALAAERGWVLQLCHFHLVSRLQLRRGRRKRHLADRRRRETLYQLTRAVITQREGRTLQRQLTRLRRLVAQPLAPARLRMTVRECLRRLAHYRAYRQYPDLRLPTTTGTVEAMAGLVRALLARRRHLRSPQATRLWVTAFIRLHPEIACNGVRHQPNSFV